ncbi:MAG: retrieval of early ER protein Rer1 [Amphiamblys sp. WSBS2006]|nr:MAG: retrieval of early ER protein Rer1 [Amphiamblys sp. WSBS2006]
MQRGMQKYYDRITPWIRERWLFFFLLLLVFMFRVLVRGSHYAVCYALWIYLLNAFILFLSPFTDPDEMDTADTKLPRKTGDEFRPFIRKLPEMDFWSSATNAALLATLASFFEFANIPVFWPILVLYFFLLSFFMLRTQLEHMLRHDYVPFNVGKKHYNEGTIRF